MNTDIAVVIATNREDSVRRWLEAWREDLKEAPVYIVQDTPVLGDMDYSRMTYGYQRLRRFAWEEIDRDLGADSWIIPRRSSAIKSYGFLKARESASTRFTWTLDDDCFPEDRWQGTYLSRLKEILSSEAEDHPWWNTITPELQESAELYPRGYPYLIRERRPVMVHHGLWSNVPDLDGVTAMANPDVRLGQAATRVTVPQGKAFPMCGMNLAFRAEMTPAMYFTLQGHAYAPGTQDLEKLPFDRFDDIWAGLLVKRICDHLDYKVKSGYPGIVHTKESDPLARVEKEAPGLPVNERLWQYVRNYDLSQSGTVADCYLDLSYCVLRAALDFPEHSAYFSRLSRAMRLWAKKTS